MDEEEQNLPVEPAKKRGRKPKNPEIADAEKPAKKRGRPRKIRDGETAESATQAELPEFHGGEQNAADAQNQQSKSLDETLDSEVRKRKSGAGRGAKIPRADGPTWRDTPAPTQSEEPERAENGGNDESEIFVHSDRSDDFAYTASGADSTESENSADGGDDEIPTSFSTTDEDLDPDAYRNDSDAERRIAEAREYENAADDDEPRDAQNRRNPRDKNFNRFNNRQNQQQQRRDNRNNDRNQNNRRANDNRNDRQNRQQNNNRQQGAERGQNQQQRRDNRNDNRQQQKQQKQKKPRWSQNGESDFINPADLPEWFALRNEAALKNWLAQVFFGMPPFPESFETAIPVNQSETPDAEHQAREQAESATETEAAVDANAAQTEAQSETQPENGDANSSQAASPESDATPATEEPAKKSVADMNYWELMVNANDSAVKKYGLEKAVGDAEKPQTAAENGADSAAQSGEEAAEFSEGTTLEIDGCGAIESLGDFGEILKLGIREIREKFAELGVPCRAGIGKAELLADYFKYAFALKKLVRVRGTLDVFEDGFGGAITFASENYRLGRNSVYVPQMFVDKYGLKRGHTVGALAMPPREFGRENCPIAVAITSVMDGDPEKAKNIVPFTDLTPYYPTRRIILESTGEPENLSMRAVDLLTPIGFGQRALIVAPPRTGKTVLMQGMAKSIRRNAPDAHLIILLVDERPEEVTDFKRNVDAEVVASTFDEEASSHVHAAEMVVSRARRMVERGLDVVILLDSITRLARAYNALMPNGGRTMSGGVEANALQKPKKFFGSARNIEGGGSLTIIGTALVETGSKMDEVIFEEFKGTGNLELHLDRALSDKRIFPAINIEKSGTRKEELLYHPDEMSKIYALRRAMKGVPATDAMEMLVQRLKKVRTNVEFLLGLNR